MSTQTIRTLDITLQELADMLQSGPVIVRGENTPAYAIVPLDEVDYESLSLSDNPDFIAIIERSRDRYRREGGVTLDEARRQLGLAT